MPFNNEKAIFLQIADRLSDEILAGVYQAFDRVPSVREYAAKLGVNANTAVKAYDQLAQEGIIFNKRGLGYFGGGKTRSGISGRPAVRRSSRPCCPSSSAKCGSSTSPGMTLRKALPPSLKPRPRFPASPPSRLFHPVSLPPRSVRRCCAASPQKKQ